MAGNDENLGKDVYKSDESEGIIPRASYYLFKYLL
jgi:hypothetical protein